MASSAKYTYKAPVLLERSSSILSQPIELAMTFPSRGFNAYTMSRKYNDIYIDTHEGDTVWQPDVYLYARELAKQRGIRAIVDVGCGDAQKLLEAFGDKEFNTIGIDYAGSLRVARKRHSDHVWIEANFTDAQAIEAAFGAVRSDAPQLYILSDVIEHIVDPRLLLRKLRGLLKQHPDSLLVISTPDAEKGISYNETTRLPNNTCHVREWNLEGLVQFLRASGFSIIEAGHTRSNQYDEKNDTCLLTVSASEASHKKTIHELGLPSPRRSIIITTEHADTTTTGGIGSYIKEVENVMGEHVRPIVMFCGGTPFTEMMTTPEKADNIIDIRDIVYRFEKKNDVDYHSLNTSIFEAAQNIIYMYDQLKLVEYQDYLGVGARLAQGKKVNAIPPDVILLVRGHGSQVYVDRSTESWSGLKDAGIFELERMGVRYADVVSSPTRYLRDLYLSTGYDLAAQTTIQRLPYSYGQTAYPTYRQIDTLLFLGKRTTMKGYDDFCYLAKAATDPESDYYLPQITTVIVIARGNSTSKKLDDDLVAVLESRGIAVELVAVERSEVLVRLQRLAGNALLCLPYQGDNHPVTVLESIECHIDFVAYDRGGIPELIPDRVKDDFLCYADKNELVKCVARKVKVSAGEREKRVREIYQLAVKDQKAINSEVKKLYLEGVPPESRYTPAKGEDVTVMVPCYATKLEYVEEVIKCINQQSMLPYEVIFVNDATPDGTYAGKLKALIDDTLSVPYRIITHEKNMGLAAARNTALGSCQTKYLINVDSDDTLSNDYVYDYVTFMHNNPEYSVAISALESFSEEDQPNTAFYEKDRIRYLGLGDCYIFGMARNIFGHSGSCVDVEAARRIGGWDASDRSMWEDWAFYLKLTSAGGKIFNFPKINYFYRVSAGSMARTYPRYPAQLRLVRNITGLNIWESQRLFACLNNPSSQAAMPKQAAKPFAYKVVDKMRPLLHRMPIVRRSLRYIVKKVK